MEASFDKLKELNLSRDEVNRIGEALKNQEFRKLLCDYVDEIQDPQNRQIYEDEIKELEKERGQDVIFLHPTPGYVIKTSIDGMKKAFINICSNENIDKPTSSPTTKDGVRGLQWSLPHSLSPPREDVDNKGVRCQVFDIIFHPDSLHLASKNGAFRTLVNNTALEATENNFNVNLDKKNIKFPKLNYKGVARPSILRKESNSKAVDREPEEKKLFDKIYASIDAQSKNGVNNNVKNSPTKSKKLRRGSVEGETPYTTPKYIIKHRTNMDIQDFTESRDSKLNATFPKELVVEINLPLLKSSNDIDLDVTEKTVQIISEKPAKYKLNLTLPYRVNEAAGTAKFDKDLKKLIVSLPVKQKKIIDIVRDDSGMESDPNSPTGLEEVDHFSDHQLISEISPAPSEKDTVLNYVNNNIVSNNGDIQIRTQACDNVDDFLGDSKLYNVPEFTCNVFENVIAFTFNVKNVDESSVKKIVQDGALVKIKFTSISPSFYPSYYAFFVKFENSAIIPENGVTFEVWDNNVILHLSLDFCDIKEPLKYLCGSNESNLVERVLEEPSNLNKQLKAQAESDHVPELTIDELEQHPQVQNRQIKENGKTLNLETIRSPKKELNFKGEGRKISFNQYSNAIDIPSHSYESSGDELSCSSFSPRKCKGILKRLSQRARFGRSISESSLDEYMCSSFENCQSLESVIPEETEMSTSLKKTVRFSDVIAKQIFRSNSSILGQKKKNQRKARNKKRAHDRRASESEASDSENKKEGDEKTATQSETEETDDLEYCDENAKEDGDIFHLEMVN